MTLKAESMDTEAPFGDVDIDISHLDEKVFYWKILF